MSYKEPTNRLLFDFFIHEAENLHNRADWFLVFHGILFEGFVTSGSSTHRVALGTLGVLVSWVWLVAGIRQQWALRHLAECMADARIMDADASKAFRLLWHARTARESWVTKFQATPAFSIVLPLAVLTTWFVLVSTHTEGGIAEAQALLIAIAAIIVVSIFWSFLYNWPPIPSIEGMSPESPDPETSKPKGVFMRLFFTMTCVVVVVLVLSGYLAYRQGCISGYRRGYSAGLQLAMKDAVPLPVQHHYRFERNGASLWRYDEATGESCQIESSVADAWIGGRCPPSTMEGQK